MKWITTSVQDTPWYSGEKQIGVYHNQPVNMERVIMIDKGAAGSDKNRVYFILFTMAHNYVNWYFQDELTRDNRLQEIMVYLEAKNF